MVDIAQPVEHLIVVQKVARSSRVWYTNSRLAKLVKAWDFDSQMR